jgi:hypothetical protein
MNTPVCVRAALAAFALTLVVAAPAAAADDGIPLGPLVAKPSVRIEAIYDSNVYREQRTPDADIGLGVTPRFELIFPGENFRWELEAYYRFFTYFNVGGIDHAPLRDLANFGIGTTVDANRLGKFGFWASPSFANRRGCRGADRVIGGGDPNQLARCEGSDLSYELTVRVPIEFRIRPTNAFQIGVDAHWEHIRAYFPVFNPDPQILGQTHDVGGGLSVDWKFFPRSHFLVDADVGHIFVGPSDPLHHDPAVENTYWRAKVGIKGDVTRKLSMMGMVGYGNVYLGASLRDQNLTGLDGIIGQAEIALRPIISQRLALGFNRDFSFLYYAYHIMDTQVYFKYTGTIADRLGISARVVYTFRDIGGDEGEGADPGIPRTENQFLAAVNVEVMIAQWFHILAGYQFSAVPRSSTNAGEYIDNRVNLGVVVGFR